MPATDAPTPEQMVLLTQIIREISRRRLSPEDAEDFAQVVHLRLIEREYDVIHQFRGRSSLRTYLTVVVLRILLDWRNEQYGKWRPSAAAVQLGVHAISFERLTSRDGLTSAEAIEVMCANDGCQRDALETLVMRLPIRPRRRRVSEREAIEVATGFEDQIDRPARRIAARRVLTEALRGLCDEDRQLLRARFSRSHSIQALAKATSIDARQLYQRLTHVLRNLRDTLRRAGITNLADIMEATDHPHVELRAVGIDRRRGDTGVIWRNSNR
jgi:RNA polymerase sigma factor (sigma-70 family)